MKEESGRWKNISFLTAFLTFTLHATIFLCSIYVCMCAHVYGDKNFAVSDGYLSTEPLIGTYNLQFRAILYRNYECIVSHVCMHAYIQLETAWLGDFSPPTGNDFIAITQPNLP